MNTFDIHAATPNDLAGMAVCHTASFPDRPMSRMGPGWLEFLYDFYLKADGGVSIVAHDGDRVVGLAVGGDRSILKDFRRECTRRFPIRLAWRTIVDPVVRRPVLAALRKRLIRSSGSAHPSTDDPNRASLLSICVLESTRGSGVASSLMESFEKGCLDGGFSSLQLSVLADNARARRFYEKNHWNLEPGGAQSVRYRRSLEQTGTAQPLE